MTAPSRSGLLTDPRAVFAHLAVKYPNASEERVAALAVHHFEQLLGRPVRPKVPEGAPFPDEPLDVWLRELKTVAGVEYRIVRDLLSLPPATRTHG